MSIGPVNKETTYKYSIDGDILTLTIEQRDGKNNLNTVMSAKFKKSSGIISLLRTFTIDSSKKRM